MNDNTPKILIVEDEESVARVLKDKINKVGFDAKYTLDGKSALAMLSKGKFDLVVLDLILPFMDGFQLLEEVKKRNIQVPVIISSNLSSEEDIKRAKELGAKEYFLKVETPIDDLVKKIKKILGHEEK